MRKKKVFDDEWKAKKVWTALDKKSKSSYAYKNKLGKYKNRTITQSSKPSFLQEPQKEVVVKITGSNTTLNGLRAHLNYISRHGEEIMTSDFEVFGKGELKKATDSFNKYYEIPTQNDLEKNNQKEKREALHIVFSMKDAQYAPPSKIKASAMKTISEMYPNNHYAVAVHTNTDNPHCHLVLKVKDIWGDRINPHNADLQKMREKFAENLRDLGVEAVATKKKGKVIENYYYDSTRHKPHHYEVVDFGRAPYKFNQDNQESFFVRYRTSKGKEIDIWADDLERVVAENDINIGEYVRFAIVDETPKTIRKFDKRKNQYIEKTFYKKTWGASIENRAEKVLNPLKHFTPNDYKIIDAPEISPQNEISKPNNEQLVAEISTQNEKTIKVKTQENAKETPLNDKEKIKQEQEKGIYTHFKERENRKSGQSKYIFFTPTQHKNYVANQPKNFDDTRKLSELLSTEKSEVLGALVIHKQMMEVARKMRKEKEPPNRSRGFSRV
ncbi:MobP1 family relaxase [Campylobacter sp. JMF_08 NE1]|uniref:MobP1 family relaxase n=1 Tax=Campylobacter sp. JMF_08 NE1 TaxID=2983821 RepID=UPI0022EA0DCB|nr:MobP1 family relaxase [Campylobacter sp. JMF_08 NE1]MDA3048213.1 relaxase/mobilization nuclease domain-containing protein [Campylobacter sp. JMF_08 NE1]